jgi:hypothetical protein
MAVSHRTLGIVRMKVARLEAASSIAPPTVASASQTVAFFSINPRAETVVVSGQTR